MIDTYTVWAHGLVIALACVFPGADTEMPATASSVLNACHTAYFHANDWTFEIEVFTDIHQLLRHLENKEAACLNAACLVCWGVSVRIVYASRVEMCVSSPLCGDFGNPYSVHEVFAPDVSAVMQLRYFIVRFFKNNSWSWRVIRHSTMQATKALISGATT